MISHHQKSARSQERRSACQAQQVREKSRIRAALVVLPYDQRVATCWGKSQPMPSSVVLEPGRPRSTGEGPT
jgi:hypothetical protein